MKSSDSPGRQVHKAKPTTSANTNTEQTDHPQQNYEQSACSAQACQNEGGYSNKHNEENARAAAERNYNNYKDGITTAIKEAPDLTESQKRHVLEQLQGISPDKLREVLAKADQKKQETWWDRISFVSEAHAVTGVDDAAIMVIAGSVILAATLYKVLENYFNGQNNAGYRGDGFPANPLPPDPLINPIHERDRGEYIETFPEGEHIDPNFITIPQRGGNFDDRGVDIDQEGVPDVFYNQGEIEWDKQGKHIRGHRNFIEGRSELTHPDPQGLVMCQQFSGQKVKQHNVNFQTHLGLNNR